jgi:lipopolysaccharide transport system ATP-binding protein
MNEIENAITARDLSKVYCLYDRPQDRLKQMFVRKRKKLYRDFWALKDISFEVKKGEALGIIGRNGAGKSTLLQILAGTLSPTSGEVSVKGRVASLLELGSGFNPEFTGRENVYLNGSILGFNRSEMDELFDEIASFADIGEFMDQPVKLYSSGMYVRLAFAVQACITPDTLIVDEALSVGDIFFQQKCHARMQELIARGTAIVLVSHNMQAIEKYSTKAILLDRGACIFMGQPNEAVERYYQITAPTRSQSLPRKVDGAQKTEMNVHGFKSDTSEDWPFENAFLDISGATLIGEENVSRCIRVAVCNDKGERCTKFRIGDIAFFYYEFGILQDIEIPVGGIIITNKMNINIHGKNSLQYLVEAPSALKKGTFVRFKQKMRLTLAPGEYTFQITFSTISKADRDRAKDMDYLQLRTKLRTILRVRQAGRISVHMKNEGFRYPFYGYVDLEGSCSLSTINDNGYLEQFGTDAR